MYHTRKKANVNWKGKRWDSNIEEVGWKLNMNNMSAVLGMSNLERREKIIGSHKKNASIYKEMFFVLSVRSKGINPF